MIEQYLIHLAIIVGIYLILALGLQITVGLTGILNLGHIALFGIGAYTSAILVKAGFSFWIGISAGALLAALIGGLLILFVHRLKGDYVALATLGFTFVTYAVLLNWTSLTRGPLGIPGITKPTFFDFVFGSSAQYLGLVVLFVLLAILVYWFMKKSYFGLTLQAIRDNELASKSLGRNTLAYKFSAMTIAGFFAGVAGSLYAHYITYIDPSSFTIFQLMPVLIIVIVAGLTSLRGTIIAAIIIILLPEPLRFLGFPSSIVGPMRQIMYVLILFAILYFKPKGLFGKVEL